MKKIGIVTFFKANNYGVCLQAIATSEFLKRQGYEVDIINYINPYEHRKLLPFDKTLCNKDRANSRYAI